MTTLNAQANTATAQALSAGANPAELEIARKYLGKKDFIGYCQAFVNRISGGKTSGASAIQAWNSAQQRIAGTQGLQPGDLVYFTPNKSNSGYGHTGVYAGNNQFISATNAGIRQNSIMDWMKQTGQKLLGYVPTSQRNPAPAVRPERVAAQPRIETPVSNIPPPPMETGPTNFQKALEQQQQKTINPYYPGA